MTRDTRSCAALLLCAAMTACGGSAHPVASADCQGQVRLEAKVYTSYGVTESPAERFGPVERAGCEDVGRDARGSVFPEESDLVTAWVFDGYPSDEVLGVRFGEGTVMVYVADDVPAWRRNAIHRDLS